MFGVAVPGMAVDDEAELRVGPNGWCFLGSLSEEKRNDFVARIVTDPRLSEIVSVCEGGKFSQVSYQPQHSHAQIVLRKRKEEGCRCYKQGC